MFYFEHYAPDLKNIILITILKELTVMNFNSLVPCEGQ